MGQLSWFIEFWDNALHSLGALLDYIQAPQSWAVYIGFPSGTSILTMLSTGLVTLISFILLAHVIVTFVDMIT